MSKKPKIGFIGVGAMGGPMAAHLAEAGYPVLAVDSNPERLERAAAAGASIATAEQAVREAAVLCLSLPSSDVCALVADSLLLPALQAGQIVIDFGTTTLPETRRLAEAAKHKGAAWLEAPVSGGEQGAKKAQLRLFVGGELEVFQKVRPILETVGGAEHLNYCGPTGSGQAVKGVNQLAMGLGAAAYLEAVAFGVRSGVSPDIIAQAVGAEKEPWRALVMQTARDASEGRAEQRGVKFRELPYFLREASEAGFSLPLTEALFAFCDAGPRVVIDDNREAPSFWHELIRQKMAKDTDNG